jgi:hypothetical protein
MAIARAHRYSAWQFFMSEDTNSAIIELLRTNDPGVLGNPVDEFEVKGGMNLRSLKKVTGANVFVRVANRSRNSWWALEGATADVQEGPRIRGMTKT